MNPWLRRLHVILSIGGGFAGMVLTLQAICNGKPQQPGVLGLCVIFASLYCFGIFAGLQFVEQKTTRLLKVYYFLQVPLIYSPLVSWRFSSGFNLSYNFLLAPAWRFNWGLLVGSSWEFHLLQNLPWGLGANVFALGILILLIRDKSDLVIPAIPALPPDAVPPAEAPGTPQDL